MGAFGTAFTLATNIDVLPMLIYTEFGGGEFRDIGRAIGRTRIIVWAILALALFSGSTVAAG